MAEIISGSRFAPSVGYGDTSSLQGSSLLPGEKPKYSPAAAKLRPVAQVDVKSPVVANEVRTVSAEPIKPSFGMKGASRGPTIPAGNNRAVSQIAPRGDAKR